MSRTGPGSADTPTARLQRSGSAALSSAQRAARAQERLAAIVAMIAGYVDAYGYVSFGTYVSFMSGNTTQTGYLIGQRSFATALPTMLAIACFFIGVFGGAWLSYPDSQGSRRLRFTLAAALLSGNLLVRLHGWAGGGGGVDIAMLGVAMGIMNAALPRVGAQPMNLTFVTGTLNRMGTHLALATRGAPLPDAQGPWDTHAHRSLLLFAVWGAFLVGAMLGGAASPHFGVAVLLLPVFALLALAAR